MLNSEPLLASIGVDTAETWPSRICPSMHIPSLPSHKYRRGDGDVARRLRSKPRRKTWSLWADSTQSLVSYIYILKRRVAVQGILDTGILGFVGSQMRCSAPKYFSNPRKCSLRSCILCKTCTFRMTKCVHPPKHALSSKKKNIRLKEKTN